MNRPPFSDKIADNQGRLTLSWTNWVTKLWLQQNPKHGTTAQRPTTNLNIGDFYLDETLGKPIWLKSVSPIVWILATGAAA